MATERFDAGRRTREAIARIENAAPDFFRSHNVTGDLVVKNQKDAGVRNILILERLADVMEGKVQSTAPDTFTAPGTAKTTTRRVNPGTESE